MDLLAAYGEWVPAAAAAGAGKWGTRTLDHQPVHFCSARSDDDGQQQQRGEQEEELEAGPALRLNLAVSAAPEVMSMRLAACVLRTHCPPLHAHTAHMPCSC